MKHLDYSQNNYKGITKPYFKRIINAILNMMPKYDSKYPATVLDFGCGYGYIKRMMKFINPHWKVINYDIIPECSDIKDYTKIKAEDKPDVIVCSHVFEHMTPNEIKETIINFKKLNPQHYLIVATPTENWIANFLSWIMTPFIGDSHEFHKTKMNEIDRIIRLFYIPIEKRNIWTMTLVRKWGPTVEEMTGWNTWKNYGETW